ncbi:MAG: flavin reductase [Clostridia bacterium]|nr:flavin reductase [Clostridia bacterium]
MYCTRKINESLTWVGANDRRLAMFEGVYSVPRGVSYNSYLLRDEKNVLFDTVDRAVASVFFANVEHTLGGEPLDYVVVLHMEPDHSATLADLLSRHPEAKVVCNQKILAMMERFFGPQDRSRVVLVKEGDTLSLGKHTLHFVMAPMVHWPEVMVAYEESEHILFSADAFGTFGALNGALFADEVDFMRDYLDEARRYYCNIVGKYGAQVQALLKKAAPLAIDLLCPLHGFVWRKDIASYVEKYQKWSTYTPEVRGVMIAYASVYGNTAVAAEILATRLSEQGVPVTVFDVSVTPASEIVAAAFQYSHLVFASTTYNAGVFISMEELLRDLAAHNLSRRTVSLIENGSWAPSAGKGMREILEGCRDITFLSDTVTVRSALQAGEEQEIFALADTIAADICPTCSLPTSGEIESAAFNNISYGLFLAFAREGEKDNACVINTAALLTDTPKTVNVSVNKQNHTHDMILRTGVFNLSVLTEETSFDTIRDFGFVSGREADKCTGRTDLSRAENGVLYYAGTANTVICCRVKEAVDCGTHTLFIAEVTEARVLSEKPSATYAYYHKNIKESPADTKKKGYVCTICGYVYEGEELPADFICPLCKHGADVFEPLG